MININLLIKPPPRLRPRVVLASVLGAMALVGLLLAGLQWYGQYTVARVELQGHRALLETYRRTLEQNAGVEAQAQRAEAAMQALDALGQSQRWQQSAILRLLLERPPGVTITEVRIEQGKQVQVTGQAATYAAAVSYLQHLRRSQRLQGVRADHLRADPAGLATFRITAAVRGRDEP